MRLPFWDKFINKKQPTLQPSQELQLVDHSFKAYQNQKTLPPVVVPYLAYYHGILPAFRAFSDSEILPNSRSSAENKSNSARVTVFEIAVESGNEPIHFYRFRRWAGEYDPCKLYGGLQSRTTLAEELQRHERRTINKEVWKVLLTYPPTHVLHLGWHSQITDQQYTLLYIPLCFAFSGCSVEGLAKVFSDYFVLQLQLMRDPIALCAPPKKLFVTQQYLLVVAFFCLRQEIYKNDINYLEVDRRKE